MNLFSTDEQREAKAREELRSRRIMLMAMCSVLGVIGVMVLIYYVFGREAVEKVLAVIILGPGVLLFLFRRAVIRWMYNW